MSKKINVQQIIRLVYIIILIVYWIGRMILSVSDILASKYFLGIILLLSIGYLLYDYFVCKSRLNLKNIGFIFLYLVWTIIVLIINRDYGVWDGLVTTGFLCIQLYVFYMSVPRTNAEIEKEIKIIGHVLCIFACVISIMGICMYLYGIDFEVIKNNVIYSQGFIAKYGRVWGILISANLHTGTFALIALYFSLLNITLSNKKKVYWFNGINIIIQLSMLVLSGSRSTILAAYVSIAVFGWYQSKKVLNNYIDKRISYEMARVLCGILSCGVLFLACNVTTKGLPYVKQIMNGSDKQQIDTWADKNIYSIYRANGFEIAENDETKNAEYIFSLDELDNNEETKVVDLNELSRHDMENKNDVSNGRFTIWKQSFEMAKDNFICGIGNNNIQNYISVEGIDTVLSHFGHCHNTYLEVLVTNGVIGIGLLMAFLGICAWQYLLYMINKNHFNKMIGFFTAIVCALLVVILFSQDIFLQFSLNSIVFWMVLGYLMRMLDNEKTEANNEKFAFICETGLHVYNTLKFVLGNVEDSCQKSDIYIYHQFKNSHEYAKIVKELGVFNHVYEFEKYSNKKGFASKIETFLRLIFNKNTLNKFSIGDRSFIHKQYKVLVLGMITQFSNNIKALSRNADIYFLEDGMGSYYLDIEKDLMTIFYKIANVFMLNTLTYDAKKLFLNSPELCVIGSELEVCKIPGVKELAEDGKKLQICFGYKDNNQYEDKKFIYMTQPIEEVRNASVEIENEILRWIYDRVGENLILRIHPRQNMESFKQFNLDKINNFWELECEKQITDDQVLIAAFSTAQVTPKIIALKEPYIVFLYKLIGGFDSADKMVVQLKNSYDLPERIFVPETKDELEKILNSFIK